MSSLEAALRGDVGSWEGLPGDVTDAQLSALAAPTGGLGQGRLSGMPVRFRTYEGPLTAWFDDDDRAFLLWVDRRPGIDLDALGEAEKRLTDAPSRFPGTVQWVWASRGLAAYVAETEREIRALALFRPATVSFYERWLGADEGVPYRPRPTPGQS